MSKKASSSKKSSKKKAFNPIPLIVALLILILAGLSGALYLKSKGLIGEKDVESDSTEIQSEEAEKEGEMTSEKWQEGMISYNGKKYQFNTDLDIYLLMGIDTDDTVQPSTNYMEGHQADALFLLVANRVDQTLEVICIHRNTMTDIFTCDEEGNATGYFKAQICLAHAYGDGKRLSCQRTVEAVSNLFYGLPIDGFLSLNLGGIGAVNSLIGGVTLEPIQDMIIKEKDVHLVKGEKTTLTDNEAYAYLRYRSTEKFDSASERLERQKQYIDCYLQQLKKGIKGGLLKASQMFDAISDYAVTNLPLEKVIKTLMQYDYTSENMFSIQGEVKMGEVFEEFYADDDALYQLIIDHFYKEVE